MVYAIEAVGTGHVKVGYCKDIVRLMFRIAAVDTHNSAVPKLRGVIWEGSRKKEKALQAKWKPFNIKGEWFHLIPIQADIESEFEPLEINNSHKQAARMFRSQNEAEIDLEVNNPLFVSLDEMYVGSEEGWLSGHEAIGTEPEQEFESAKTQIQKNLKRAAVEGAKAGNRKDCSHWETIGQLRAEGQTFAQIGKELGKSTHAVMMAWRRAQKRLAATV